MNTEEKEFPQGIYFKLPHVFAPDFVHGSLSIKVQDAIHWLQQQQGEWVNIDLKESRDGRPYSEVNRWEPNQ